MTAGRGLLAAAAFAAAAAGAWLLRPEAPPPAPPIDSVLAASRPFSTERGLQLAPRFSVDARFVAFALAEGDDSRIVVQAVDRSSRRFIGEAKGVRVSPVFFPEGQRIAYWQAAEGGCGIFERNLATGAPRDLVYEAARAGSAGEPKARARIEEAANAPGAEGPAQIDLVIARR